MKTNTKLGSARPFWLPSHVNIDTLTNNLGFLYQHVMSKMTINKQNVHYTILMFLLTSLQVFTDGMEHQRVAERTYWLALLYSSTHFSPPDRVISQDMVGANSLQRLVISIGYGKRAHLSHMPLILNLSTTLGAKSVTQ